MNGRMDDDCGGFATLHVVHTSISGSPVDVPISARVSIVSGCRPIVCVVVVVPMSAIPLSS